MKAIVTILSLVLVSSSVFAMTPSGLERAKAASKNAALEVARTSHLAMGDHLKDGQLSVVSVIDLKQTDDTATMVVAVGVNAGQNDVSLESYVVEASRTGFVQSIRFVEEGE
jgi:hypothetical protein